MEASKNWQTFETPLGTCGVAWTGVQLTNFCLPEKSARALAERMKKITRNADPQNPPGAVRALIEKAVKHLGGEIQDFSKTGVSFDGLPEFHQRVYRSALKIRPGELRTYGDIAKELGDASASRAVGQALGKNPLGLVVPCHRVVAAKSAGGFSAPGGLETKARLLALEGVSLEKVPVLESREDLKKATLGLIKADRVLAKQIAQLGLPSFRARTEGSAYEVLFESIVHQQLSLAAAKTILARVQELGSRGNVPTPAEVARIKDADFREAGLSGAKIAAIRDLAQKESAGEIPSPEKMRIMTNEAIVKNLVAIHGVGPWTAEMLLIFFLGRQDVLPVHDFALRSSLGKIYGMKETPSPSKVAEMGEKWRPYRSVAALYLWKTLET